MLDLTDDGGLRPRAMTALVAGLALLVLAIAFLAGREQRAQHQVEMDVRLRTVVMQRANLLTRELEDWRAQAWFLSLAPPVQGLARAAAGGGYDALENSTEELWRRRLDAIFSGFALSRPGVLRISYLSATARTPLVAIDSRNGQLEPFGHPGGPDPAETALLDGVRTLTTGETYVADLDLARNDRGVLTPYQPLLRVATPVTAPGGGLFGAIAVTVDARPLLSALSADINPIFRIHLLDDQGDFLVHPDPDQTFGSARGRPQRWADQYRPLDGASTMAAGGGFLGPDGPVRVARQQVALDGGDRLLTVVVLVSDRVINEGAEATQFWVAGLGLSLTALVALLLAHGRKARRCDRQAMACDAWLGAIIDGANDAVIGLAPDGRVTSWNPAAARLFGIGPGAAIGRDTASLIVPPGLEIQESDLLARVARGENVVNLRTRRQNRDGRTIDVSITATPIAAGRGLSGAAMIIRDITEQMAAEASLRSLNMRLEHQVRERTMEIEALAAQQHAILHDAGSAIIACDRAGTITLFNPAAETMLGYRPDEMMSKATPVQFHDPAELALRSGALQAEDGQPVRSAMDVLAGAARRGKTERRTWTYIRKDGRRLPVLLAVTALHDRERGHGGYLIVATDMSGLTRQPEALPSQPAPPAIAGIDMDQAMVRMMGNRDLFDAILGQFLERYDGLAAWLRDRLAEGDVDAILRTLHEFRGVAGNIAATAAADQALGLERTLRDDHTATLEPALTLFEATLQALCAAIRNRSRPPVADAATAANDQVPLDLTALLADLRGRRMTALDILAAQQSALTRRFGRDKVAALNGLVEGLRYDEALTLLEAELPG